MDPQPQLEYAQATRQRNIGVAGRRLKQDGIDGSGIATQRRHRGDSLAAAAPIAFPNVRAVEAPAQRRRSRSEPRCLRAGGQSGRKTAQRFGDWQPKDTRIGTLTAFMRVLARPVAPVLLRLSASWDGMSW
jgi:hypothetical protein